MQTFNAMKEHVAKHEGNICCFVFEPMLGEGGYRAATRELLPALAWLNQRAFPFGRTRFRPSRAREISLLLKRLESASMYDLCTIAKTAQNGATFFTEEFKPDPGLLGGTFSGTTPAMRAGMEILTIMEQEGYMGPEGKILKIHTEFTGMLNELNETTCKGLLREAGGMGLMVAVTPLDGSKEKQGLLLKTLFKNGLICFGCGSEPYRVRFLIPAIISSADIAVAKKSD